MEPTKLYKLLVLEDANPRLIELAENPMYLLDYRPAIDAYETEIRKLQAIIREKVNLELIITESEGYNENMMFDLDHDDIQRELQNWNPITNDYNQLMTFGWHVWVTVRSARFKSRYNNNAQSQIPEIDTIRNRLHELYKPIQQFEESMTDYQINMRKYSSHYSSESDYAYVVAQEWKKFDEFRRKFLSDMYKIRKGPLSLSLVEGLVYQLKQSIDLSHNHPGD